MPVPTYYRTPEIMNPWEQNALEYNFQVPGSLPVQDSDVHDSLIHPDIYSASGFDLLSIIKSLHERPSPMLQSLGPVDESCPLLVCDMTKPDYPVVYANEACSQLTGYPKSEMVGRNCRFLQTPPPVSAAGLNQLQRPSRPIVDSSLLKQVKRAIETSTELYVELPNFKKSGETFLNCLTMIPCSWGQNQRPRYYVGFMAERHFSTVLP
ncbi:vivid PAS protein VVD [Poronia punctata]|nr:vivid PAS protein VVD [Poronia punctata]